MTGEPVPARRWWRPPQLRTLHHGGERHASWLELFFDLVLVVAIAQACHVFVHHPGGAAALEAGALFVVVFLAWQGFSFYADRFDTDDFPYRVATFVQMLAILVLAGQMREVVQGSHALFALAFAVVRGVLVLLYWRAYRHAEVARPLIRRYGGVYAISVGIWLLSIALPAPWWLVAWIVAVLLDLSMPPLNTRLHRAIPTDVSHVPERFGLFTLIVLGELVVTVGVATMGTAWTGAIAAVAMLGFGVAACLWWLYFERLGTHELRHESRAIVTFAYAHLPLLAGLVFAAGGLNVLIKPEDAGAAQAGAIALCGGVAAFVAALSVAHAQLEAPALQAVVVARWCTVAALLLVPFVSAQPLLVTGATFAVLVALVGYEAARCAPESGPAAEGETPHGD